MINYRKILNLIAVIAGLIPLFYVGCVIGLIYIFFNLDFNQLPTDIGTFVGDMVHAYNESVEPTKE